MKGTELKGTGRPGRPVTTGRAPRPAPAAPTLIGRALIGPVLTSAIAVGAARGAYAALRRYPPAGEKTWTRTNHRGELVTLLEGPAVAIGAVTAQVISAAVAAKLEGRAGAAPGYPERPRGFAPQGTRTSVALAGLGGLAFGLLDDLRGSGKRRGLRGHLGALAHGEVTTGAVKLAGLAATGLGSAVLEGGDAADIAINSGLIAGGANLLNLFDLRPGRAIKVAAGSSALIAGASAGLAAVAAPAGAALALMPEDLGERAMLGDAGANALGAMLGAAAASALPRRARIGLLAGIALLTVMSEKVSFTKVIERTPPLRWLDMLGRRPAPLTAPVSANAPGPAPRPRRPGRHRRAETGVSRIRPDGWLPVLVKTLAR